MKRMLVIALAVLPVTLFAQDGGAFTLKGKIGTLNDPDKVFLTYQVGDKVISDSSTLKDGVFGFNGNVPEPLLADLQLRHGAPEGMTSDRTDRLAVYLEKGIITITGKDSIATAIVKGYRLNEDLLRLIEKLKATSLKKEMLMKEYYGAKEEERNSEKFKNTIVRKGDAIQQEEKKGLVAFVKDNPTSFVSLNALQYYVSEPPVNEEEFESLFNRLSTPLKSSTYGKAMEEMIKGWKQTAIGAMAPGFTQNDTLNKPVSLADFRGKYILLDFWASWCGPCRKENPNVVAAYNEYKNRKFTILSVSLDQPAGRNAWLKAIHDDKLAWTHVSDLKGWGNEVAKSYNIRSIPRNFLVDPSGKIIARDLYGEDLKKKLEQVLR